MNPKPVRVWFTRTLSAEEAAQAASLGIEAHVVPLTEISFFSEDVIRARCQLLPEPQAFLFTSRNAVEAFLPVAEYLPVPSRIFAVGARTAERLSEAGFKSEQPAATAQHGTATGELIAATLAPDDHVWHFAAAQPRPEAREVLQAAGISYHQISCYETRPLKPSKLPENPEAVAFYSPSTVQAWQQLPGRPGAALPVFAIGHTTARALREAGVPVIIEAAQPSTAHLLQAIRHFFDADPTPGKSPAS